MPAVAGFRTAYVHAVHGALLRFSLFTAGTGSACRCALVDWLRQNAAEQSVRAIWPLSSPCPLACTEEIVSMANNAPRHPDRKAVRPSAVPAADVLRWRQVFPGEPRQLGVLRRSLVSLLPECPARDDVISVATELASNALRHTASGHSGRFTVEVAWGESAVRVGVADGGSPTEPHVIQDPAAEHGRGLLLVDGLSERTGVAGDHRGRLVWADIAWNSRDFPAHSHSRDPAERDPPHQATLAIA